jgi:hypothetical protein
LKTELPGNTHPGDQTLFAAMHQGMSSYGCLLATISTYHCIGWSHLLLHGSAEGTLETPWPAFSKKMDNTCLFARKWCTKKIFFCKSHIVYPTQSTGTLFKLPAELYSIDFHILINIPIAYAVPGGRFYFGNSCDLGKALVKQSVSGRLAECVGWGRRGKIKRGYNTTMARATEVWQHFCGAD